MSDTFPTVLGSASLDDLGRVLMVSNAAPSGAQLFEFGVDKIIECKNKKNKKACAEGTVTIPGEFARFEATTFRVMSSIGPGGSGVDPVPFMVFMGGDVFLPQLEVFGSEMITEPTPPALPEELVRTIPADLESYELVESLMVRSLGDADRHAPVVMAVDRGVLINGCTVAEGGIPLPSTGAGVAGSPFTINAALTALALTDDEVSMDSHGGLFLNGDPTTEADLLLLTGTTGTVLITIDGSICTPQGYDVSNLDLFAGAIVQGTSVSEAGFTYNRTGAPIPAAPVVVDVSTTALGSAVGQALFSTAGNIKASASVIDGQP